MYTAAESYAQIERSYLSADPSSQESLREHIAATDFLLRFTTMCAAAMLREIDPNHVRMHRSFGFGSYIGYLKWSSSFLAAAAQTGREAAERVADLVNAVSEQVAQLGGRDRQFGSLTQLRNHIAHGGPIPEGPTETRWKSELTATNRAMSAAILRFISTSAVTITDAGENLDSLTLQWPGNSLCLWPFVCADKQGRWCVYSNFSGTKPIYIRRDVHEVRVEGRGEDLLIALTESLIPTAEDKTLAVFVGDLKSDIEGFRDSDSEPYHDELEGMVSLLWVRATSGDPEERVDHFRIGKDHRREWQESAGRWRPYSAFLRYISNWSAVARATRQRLERIERKLLEDERQNLDWSQGSGDKSLIPPRIRVTDLQGTLLKRDTSSFEELELEIDQSLSVHSSQTTIYFISGEAGIGKTRSLLSAALARAREVESESGDNQSTDRLPIFLYVKSTGQVLNSLSTVVNDAVTYTRNLNEKCVQTLCRNGLMALFVDGFDELLGGVGYDNALGSLQPWIEALGGRGVIIVSARSSYYLNQYKSSLRKNQNIPVRHHVAEFQRWNQAQLEEFLESHEIPNTSLDELTNYDRNLLSLPFFARVFAEAVKTGTLFSQPLPDIVMAKYIARESGKLSEGSADQRVLLSGEELRSVFENLAQIMAEGGSREVSLSDLQYAAQLAISDDLSSRRGLANRLTVLCGISIAGAADADRKFEFQHEIFYDIFLADALLVDLNLQNFDLACANMRKTQWRAATVSRMTRINPAGVHALLVRAGVRVRDSDLRVDSTFRSNLGALWRAMIEHQSTSEYRTISGAIFDDLDLTQLFDVHIKFLECEFRALRIPPEGTWSLEIENCRISFLEIGHNVSSLQGLRSFEGSVALQMLNSQGLWERPNQISSQLHKQGANVSWQPPAASTGRLPMEAVEYFLENIWARSELLYVLAQGYKVPEGHGKWPHEFGDNVWRYFIRALRDSGAAALEPLSTGGATLLRVKFKAPVELLHNRIISDDTVRNFWDMVSDYQ